MISTGMTGTARQGTSPNRASVMRTKTLDRRAPPSARIAPAPAPCAARRPRLRQPQCEIGDHRGAEVELTAVEQRPPAVRALAHAKIGGNAPLHVVFDGAEIMLQQDVGSRHRGVGVQFEYPVAIPALQRQQ